MNANGSRQSRPGRRPRPVVSSGREREFPTGNGELGDGGGGASGLSEESEALLRKLRAL